MAAEDATDAPKKVEKPVAAPKAVEKPKLKVEEQLDNDSNIGEKWLIYRWIYTLNSDEVLREREW